MYKINKNIFVTDITEKKKPTIYKNTLLETQKAITRQYNYIKNKSNIEKQITNNNLKIKNTIDKNKIAELKSDNKKLIKQQDLFKKYQSNLNEYKEYVKSYNEYKKVQEQKIINNINVDIKNFIQSNTATKTINFQDYQEITSNEKIMKNVISELAKNKDNKYIMSSGKKYITLNEHNYKKLLDVLNNVYDDEQVDSLVEHAKNIKNSGQITFKKLTDYTNYKFGQRKGGYFKYLNNTNIDLEKYGIFQEFKNENYDNNCIFNALKFLGMDEIKLNDLNLSLNNRYISLNDLEELAIKYNICLSVKYEYESGRTEKRILNKDAGIKYDLGLLEEHYFILEKVNYTSYSIEHYDILHDKKYFNEIIYYKEKSIKREQRFIDSYDLIKILIKNKDKYLKEIKPDIEILGNNFYNKVHKINNLEYDDEYMKENNLIIAKNKKDKKYLNVFFNIQATTQGIHKPYLICSVDDKGNELKYNVMKNGEQFIYNWLCNIKENVCLIAYNTSYDYKFIYNYLTEIQNEIIKGTNLIVVNAMFYNKHTNAKHKIKIVNCKNLIPLKLEEFKNTFKLEHMQQVINYKIYTETNIENIFFPIEEFKKDMTQQEQIIFSNYISNNNLIDETKFDIIKYAGSYCINECKLLKNGYNKFKENVKKNFNLEIDNYLTIPSMSEDYLINNNCFDGCYNLSGVPQVYISKCVVGGRSISQNNKKLCIDDDKIICLDKNSLYTYAMSQIKGFPKGTPKPLKQDELNLEFLKNQTAYYIQIKILKVNIKLKMPLTYMTEKDGTRFFTNNVENEIMFVGHIYFEDLIKYQNINYVIIDGYYFNEGYNNNINKISTDLYEKRNELKKNNNPEELIYKLFMNSSYGRTILKPVETKTKIKSKRSGYDKYILRHFDEIKEIVNISNEEDEEYSRYKINLLKNISTHKNSVHIGVDILDYSKRIMNEVICLGEKLNINIFYEDTDSIHLYKKDLQKLQNEYFKMYDKILIGDGIEQFKSEFKDWTIDKKLIDIHSNTLIILGKKAYLDVLQGTHKETGQIYYNYHYRLKGINQPSIDEKCKQLNINEFELYKLMFKGKEIEFNLSASGTQFKFNKDYTINTNDNFKRIIQY